MAKDTHAFVGGQRRRQRPARSPPASMRATPAACDREQTDQATGSAVPPGRDETKLSYISRSPPALFSYHPPTYLPTDGVKPAAWRPDSLGHLRGADGCSGWIGPSGTRPHRAQHKVCSCHTAAVPPSVESVSSATDCIDRKRLLPTGVR